MALNLSPELLDAAKAIGLLDANGNFDSAWFEHAFDRAQTILSNPQQRAALLSMFDRLAPPRNPPGTPANEKWHPLLGEQPRGNAYITVRNSGGTAVLGVAGEVHGAAAGGVPEAALRVHVPLLSFGAGSPQLAAGAAGSPFALDLRVRLDLDRADGEPLTLEAVRVSLRWAVATGAGPSILIVLEGLGLNDGGTRDLTLDPTELGSAAIEVVTALVKQLLPSTPAAAALSHLLGLLGLDEDDVPPLPFTQLAQGPAALQAWLNALITGGHLGTWLGHFGGLVGQPVTTVGAGTLDDPKRVKLIALGTNGAFEVGVAHADARLHLSFGVRVAPNGANPAARLDARATLVAIPLAGTGSALALPAAHLMVTAPGGDSGKLVNEVGTIVVDRLNAGARWNGATSTLVPTVELLGVTMGATPRLERVDLTHADSVADAAAAGLQAALTALLGGAGAPLLAFAGLAPPQGAPGGWPHLITTRLQDFATAPTRTLGQVHRAMLQHPTQHWGFLLDELRRLLGLAGSLSGEGTPASPWLVPLASTSALSVGLAAWNDTPGDPVARLRLGLRAQVLSAPWELAWRTDVLGFDIAADGSAQVRLLGGQTASLAVGPFPALTGDAGVGADALTASLQWRPDNGLRGQASLSNLVLRVSGTDFPLGTLTLPPAVPIDLAVPASLPLPAAQLQRVLSALVARLLADTTGVGGLVAGAVLGLHAELPGLPDGWPTLFDPADALRFATDPRAALRSYLDRLVQGAAVGAPTTPQLTPHLHRLLAWLQHAVQRTPGSPETASALTNLARGLPGVRGSGLHADPWLIPLHGAGASARTELLLWLDPDGAPGAWSTALAAALNNAGDATMLLRAAAPLVSLVPALREALQGASIDALGAGLGELARSLEDSDGFVPLGSQRVVHADWQLGATIPDVSHALQPSHAQLIDQALDQVATWEPVAANRAVLPAETAAAS